MKDGSWTTNVQERLCPTFPMLPKAVCGNCRSSLSSHEPPAHSARVLSRNQYKARACIDRFDRNEAVDARHAEGSVLHLNKFFEHLMIEGELMDVVDAVREEAEQAVSLVAWVLVDQLFQSDLQSLGQIEVVGEIEGSIFLECLDHINEFFIISRARKNDKC